VSKKGRKECDERRKVVKEGKGEGKGREEMGGERRAKKEGK